MKNLSLIQQNYIEAIYDLCKEHGHAHTKSIAEKLEIRMASATEAVQMLSAAGFVNYNKRQAVTLTEKGNNLALELEGRHAILSEFFKLIGSPTESAEDAACKVEHHIDSEITSLLKKHIEECKKKN